MADKICPRCKGTGLADQYADDDCDYCGGDGVIILGTAGYPAADRIPVRSAGYR